jgi:thiol:disulfide interchange protein DsbG
MRWTAGFLIFLATPAFAAAPLCALPGHTAMKVTAAAPVSASPAPVSSKPLPPSLSQIAFAQHVASAGAQVRDLGSIHGLRAIAARNGSEFMLFEVAPDGQAGVSGVPIDLSVAQLQSVAAGNITDVGEAHGLRGYFVRSGQQFQVFYATPDGSGLIPGVMWDAAGKDVTRQQVAQIPGAVPTIEVGAADGQPVGDDQALPLIKKATYGTTGASTAPELFMFMDPQCIYSIRAYQELQPYVQSGRLQIAIIPLSVLDYEDQGQSTRSALALLSDPPDQIAAAWQAGGETNVPNPAAEARLANNMAIAHAIGLKGTPMFWWQKADGSAAHFDGVPTDAASFVAALGS